MLVRLDGAYLHNNAWKQSLELHKTIVLVRSVNVHPKTIFAGNNSNRLGAKLLLTNVILVVKIIPLV